MKLKNFLTYKSYKSLLNKAGINKIYKIILFIILISIAAGLFFIFHKKSAEAAWWDENWGYRKKIDLSNASGSELLDFQAQFTIDTAALIAAGKMQSDCGDLRLTDGSGNAIAFWIEENNPGCNSATTRVWARVGSIPTAGTAIYAYYGNSWAEDESSGEDTFYFFDGFSSFDTAKWSATGAYSVADGKITITTGSVYTDSTATGSPQNLTTEMKARYANENQALSGICIANAQSTQGNNAGSNAVAYNLLSNTGISNTWGADGTTASYNIINGTSIYDSATNNDYLMGFTFLGSSNVDYYVKNLNYALLGSTTPSGTWNQAFYLWLGYYSGSAAGVSSGNDLEVDWVRVRKYAAAEPTATVGAESAYPGAPAAFWRFDEGYGTTANDDSGNKNTGTISGATWQDESMCVSGKCLRFDGSNDYVSVANTVSSVKTVSFWAKATSTTSSFINLNGSAYVKSVSGVISATGFTSPTIYVNGQVSSTFAANSWQMITITTDTGLSASALNIGKITQYFGGFLDEVKVYPYARTAEQIKKDYAAGSSGSGAAEGAAFSMGGGSEKWMSDGLVGYWRMDESYWSSTTDEVLDASGNNNNGTPWNGATTTVGRFGNGGYFDGTDDYMRTADSNSLNFTDKYTVSVWVKCNTLGTGWQSLVHNNNIGNQWSWGSWFAVDTNNNKIRFNLAGTSVTSPGDSSITLVSGKWYNFTGIYDGSTAKIYQDGVEVRSWNTSGNISNDGRIYLGREAQTGYFVNGSMDEIRIYNRALSPEEVRKLYEWAPGPVAHWKMDEKSGQYAYDSSGNGNTGTLGAAASAGTDDPAWTRGKFGNGLSFDGSNDYIQTGTTPVININNISMSVSGWYKVNSGAGTGRLFSKATGTDSAGGLGFMATYFNTGRIAFEYYNSSLNKQSGTTGTGLIAENKWYHISINLFDNGKVEFFINGNLVTTDTDNLGGLNPASAQQFTIGALSVNKSAVFNGSIDDVRIYNYARTQKQIIEDMNAGHPAGGSPVGSAVAWWKLDEGFGTTAHDQTRNKNDLTISNPVSWTNFGKYGKAWHGTSTNWMYKTDDADFDVTDSDDYSISLWFKSAGASNPSGLEYLVNKMSASAGYGLYFGPQGDLAFAIDDDTTWGPDDRASSTADVYDNEWHHAVAVKTATSSIKLYIDKKLAGSDTSISAIATLANSASLYIGDKDGADNGNEFTGDLDEIKIFRFAMDEDEIETEYNRGAALVMGSLSSDSSGAASSSAASAYCVPGDTAQCDAPVAEWKMDEKSGLSAYDSSGNNNTGTLTNGPTWTRGKMGSGLQFDGENDYVINDGGIDLSSGGSLSAWFKPNSLTEAEGTLVGVATGGSPDRRMSLTLYNNNVRSSYYDGTSRGASGNINNVGWHYAVAVWNGNILSLYIDGVLQSGNNAAANGAQDKLIIGARTNEAQNFYKGLIDNVRIYNYARTPAQIAWDYNRGKPVVWYGFNECQGTTAHNEINKSDNGTITIGGTGSQNYVGSCASSSASYAWYNGRDGKVNKAISLDGTDDVVTITNSTTIDLNSSNLASSTSFSAWIKADTDGEGHTGQVFWKGDNNYLRVSGELGGSLNIDASLNLTGSAATLSLSAPITTGTWNHIAMVWQDDDDDEITLYVNGLNKGSSANGSGQAAAEGNNLLIGGTTTANFDGLIDEFKIFNYPLTAEQVKTEYSGGAVRFGG